MSEHLELRKDGPIASLIINRPEKRNAISHEMWKAIPGLIAEVEADPAIKVMVLRGADGKALSAGADISEFETIRSTEEGARVYNEATEAAEHAVMGLTKPSIAMIQGLAIGGGCGLSLSCDVRFAEPGARFGITPAKLGLVYSLPATKNLVDLVGPSQAKIILFSGDHVLAEEALRIGMIDAIHPSDELEERTMEFALTVTTRAQLAVKATKRIIRLILDGSAHDTDESRRLRLESFTSEDYREGVRAFLEKRPAAFTQV